jgi:hypothetical protein
VVAGEIARASGISFKEAYRILEEAGEAAASAALGFPANWYYWLEEIQPAWVGNHPEEARFDVRTIARAAIRSATI